MEPGVGGAPRWRVRLVIGVTVAWLLFVVLHRVLSGRFWLWLLPDLVPPLVYLAGPLLLLAAAPLAGRSRRWWCSALAAASLALGAGQSGLHLGPLGPGGPAAPAGAVRVMSWNTEYWDQDDDPERFYGFLKAQRADVYLLQEYLHWTDGTPRQVDDLARLRREFPGYHIAAEGELVTLSRFPVAASPPVGPAVALGPGATWNSAFLLAKTLRTDLRIGTSIISVYNVHIPTQYMLDENPLTSKFYSELHGRDAARKAQFRGLAADVEANRNAILVSGDFNTTGAMGDIQWLSDRLSRADDDRRLYPASWPATGPALWRLDWTFTSSARIHGYRLLDPQGLSDHRAQAMLLSVGDDSDRKNRMASSN